MPFEAGHKKLGGRPKGGQNKKSAVKLDLLALCEEADFNPFQGMLDLARNSRSEDIRLAAMKEYCKYIKPQMRSSEITTITVNPIDQMSDEELHAELARRGLGLGPDKSLPKEIRQPTH